MSEPHSPFPESAVTVRLRGPWKPSIWYPKLPHRSMPQTSTMTFHNVWCKIRTLRRLNSTFQLFHEEQLQSYLAFFGVRKVFFAKCWGNRCKKIQFDSFKTDIEHCKWVKEYIYICIYYWIIYLNYNILKDTLAAIKHRNKTTLYICGNMCNIST